MAQYTHGIWGSSISAAQRSNLDLEARANALAAIRNEEPPGGSETSAATASRSTNPMEIDEDDEDGEHDEDDDGGEHATQSESTGVDLDYFDVSAVAQF
jgi:hypothetical protein